MTGEVKYCNLALAQPSARDMLRAAVAAAAFLLTVGLASCATYSSQSEWRIQSDVVPVGSLRLAQVMSVGRRSDVVESPDLYKILKASGIEDSDIVDGSIVVARIYCCGGLTEESSSEVHEARGIYVPRNMHVGVGDIVEMRVGRPPQNGDHGRLNTVTRVVMKRGQDDGSCWWDPRDDRLWLRVIYCSWMPEQGWTKQGGIHPAWFKPST
jgi:hypothetical protein